jgi:hypothetical protein
VFFAVLARCSPNAETALRPRVLHECPEAGFALFAHSVDERLLPGVVGAGNGRKNKFKNTNKWLMHSVPTLSHETNAKL